MDDFIAESALMLDFHHPNAMGLLGVCFDTEDNLPVIVLPFMVNGDLRSYLQSKRAVVNTTLFTDDSSFPEVAS